MKSLGWLLALSPFWVPIVAVCVLVLAAVVATSPLLGLFLGIAAFLVVKDRIARALADRRDG